jgi:hypothetical protein
MSLPEVLLTLARDRRRHALHLIDAATASACAFAGGEALKDFSKSMLALADPATEPEPIANLARQVALPLAPS